MVIKKYICIVSPNVNLGLDSGRVRFNLGPNNPIRTNPVLYFYNPFQLVGAVGFDELAGGQWRVGPKIFLDQNGKGPN